MKVVPKTSRMQKNKFRKLFRQRTINRNVGVDGLIWDDLEKY